MEYKSSLRLFKGICVLDEYMDSFDLRKGINEDALKYGVLMSNEFPIEIVTEAIKQYGRNGEEANQTFHKSLFKVNNSTVEELLYSQIIHYFTTYGAEELGVYGKDSVFVPSEKLDVPELDTDTIEFIVIKPMTKSEIKERIRDMITVNLALSKQTVKDIVTLSDFIDIEEYSIDDDYFCLIKNREVKSALCGKLGILPKRGEDFLRYFLAKYCDLTLLIKDKRTIGSVQFLHNDKVLEALEKYKSQYGLIPLAKVFNRFKPLFLAMKRQPKEMLIGYYEKEDIQTMKKINNIINTISKLSKKYHTPMKSNNLNRFIDWCWENIDNPKFATELDSMLKDAGIFTTIKLLNYLNYKNNTSSDKGIYKIRNGKVFIKDDADTTEYIPEFAYSYLINIVEKSIKECIGDNTIYVPNGIDYKLPQSEKQYVGNIPFGSSITLDKQSLVFGIHWNNVKDEKGVERRVDLDLHLNSNQYNIGWNGSYKDDEIIFTGDMTNAPLPNGASEYIYLGNSINDTLFNFKINNYTRDVGPIPYEIIIGTANPDDLKHNKNFVIDPNNIIMKIPMEMELGQSEQVVGVVDVSEYDIKLIFTDLTTSNLPVSRNNKADNIIREYIKEYSKCQLSLKDILFSCGIETHPSNTIKAYKPYLIQDGKVIRELDFVQDSDIIKEYDIMYKEMEVPVDIDLSVESLTKNSFINLLKVSKE